MSVARPDVLLTAYMAVTQNLHGSKPALTWQQPRTYTGAETVEDSAAVLQKALDA